MKAMLTASQVAEPIFNFLQLAFTGQHSVDEIAFEQLPAEALMLRLATAEALPIKAAMSLPNGQRKALRELLTQYVMFLTLFKELSFPEDFLVGSSDVVIGRPFLAYFAKHQWPFPQQLPWRVSP